VAILEVIDAWAQLPAERFMEKPWLETLLRWTRQERARAYGTESTLAAMDNGGVARALICAWSSPTGMLIDNDEVAAAVSAHPDRFAGVAAVDLRQPVAAVRELRRTMEELGFVGVRIVPWLWNLPPNDRRYYPNPRRLRGARHPVLHADQPHGPALPVRAGASDSVPR
jgi:predicted TIM-barrel fold metal-dependent hydrolase